MTTFATDSETAPAEQRLRSVLLTNSGFSVITGFIALVAAGAVADLLGVEQVWLVRLVGVGLLGFALGVFLVARSARPNLERWSKEVSQADFAWVGGTIVVVALGWFSTSGVLTMLGLAVAVLALGSAQWVNRRTMIS